MRKGLGRKELTDAHDRILTGCSALRAVVPTMQRNHRELLDEIQESITFMMTDGRGN